MLKKPKSKFVKIECPNCKNVQIIFGKATLKVKCGKCTSNLIKRSGGKARMRAKILEVLK